MLICSISNIWICLDEFQVIAGNTIPLLPEYSLLTSNEIQSDLRKEVAEGQRRERRKREERRDREREERQTVLYIHVYIIILYLISFYIRVLYIYMYTLDFCR